MYNALHILYFFFYHILYLRYKMLTGLADPTSISKKNRRGRLLNSIWEDIEQEESIGSRKFLASCKFCSCEWKCGEISKLEKHLANHCEKASSKIIRKYMTTIIKYQNKTNK